MEWWELDNRIPVQDSHAMELFMEHYRILSMIHLLTRFFIYFSIAMFDCQRILTCKRCQKAYTAFVARAPSRPHFWILADGMGWTWTYVERNRYISSSLVDAGVEKTRYLGPKVSVLTLFDWAHTVCTYWHMRRKSGHVHVATSVRHAPLSF